MAVHGKVRTFYLFSYGLAGCGTARHGTVRLSLVWQGHFFDFAWSGSDWFGKDASGRAWRGEVRDFNLFSLGMARQDWDRQGSAGCSMASQGRAG